MANSVPWVLVGVVALVAAVALIWQVLSWKLQTKDRGEQDVDPVVLELQILNSTTSGPDPEALRETIRQTSALAQKAGRSRLRARLVQRAVGYAKEADEAEKNANAAFATSEQPTTATPATKTAASTTGGPTQPAVPSAPAAGQPTPPVPSEQEAREEGARAAQQGLMRTPPPIWQPRRRTAWLMGYAFARGALARMRALPIEQARQEATGAGSAYWDEYFRGYNSVRQQVPVNQPPAPSPTGAAPVPQVQAQPPQAAPSQGAAADATAPVAENPGAE